MADGGYNLFTATDMKMTPLGMVAGNNFDFAKPVVNGLKLMPLRFLRFGAFPPYYGDEINIGFWKKLGLAFGSPSNPVGTIYTLQPDYKYIYNLSKKTFTIYDENGTVVFYVNGVTKMSDMKIDFTIHKSHQFEIVVNADDIGDWDYLPVSTKSQDFEANDVKVPDEGIQHVYLPDRVRPYTLLDGDNPAWRIQYIGNLWKDWVHIAREISTANDFGVEYHYIMEKQLTGLLKINETLYRTLSINNFYSSDYPWKGVTRISSNSHMKVFGEMGLLLPEWSLSLYPALNRVIKIDEVFNNRVVYEPWLIWGLKFIWSMYTKDDREEFPIDVLDLSPSWD